MPAAVAIAGTAISAGVAFYNALNNCGEVIIYNYSDQFVLNHGHISEHPSYIQCGSTGELDAAPPALELKRNGKDEVVVFPAAVAMSGKMAPRAVLCWQLFPSKLYLVVIPWLSGTSENMGFFDLTPEEPDMKRILNHAKDHVLPHGDMHKLHPKKRGVSATATLSNNNPAEFIVTLE